MFGGPKPRQEVGANPYQAHYDTFLNQIRDQAQGIGPSLAEEEYKRRQGQALQQQLAMARGRGPGAARQAAYAGGQAQQGLAQGAGQMGIAERQGAQQLYGNVLGQASNQDFMRQNANLQARLQMMGMPTDWDKLLQAGTAIGGAAMMA